MPEDFVEEIRRRDAAETARQRAIAGPQKPRRATKRPSEGGGTGGYSEAALKLEYSNVAGADEGTRNHNLNVAGFNLGQLVAAGELDYGLVVRELTSAALQAGLTERELKRTDLPQRAVRKGMGSPRDMSDKGTQSNSDGRVNSSARSSTNGAAQQGGSDEFEEEPRKILWVRASTVKTRVPQWVWEYDDVGRIQLGTVSMFAGKPAAGKSTAARWFAARITRGDLEGCWQGYPMGVAMLSFEEQEDATVVPSLNVAGADTSRVVLPRIMESGRERVFGSIRDEEQFTEGLVDNDIRALFVDPVMRAFSGKADVYRNNEVRDYLDPFVRMAQAINGIVVCVHHLRKGTVTDVLGSMNGSSAFGEVPRAVFGFAPMEAGAHVFEQVKNSAGPTGLKLEYHLPVEYTSDHDGAQFELPRFEIRGETTISIADIDENSDQLTGIAFACEWLSDYLLENQPAPVWQVQKDAKSAGAINNEKMLSRAAKRLGVVSKSEPSPGKPNQHVWMLPDFNFPSFRRTS